MMMLDTIYENVDITEFLTNKFEKPVPTHTNIDGKQQDDKETNNKENDMM